ncbi:beta-propeller fold lactonase family protein [Flavobacterium sp. RHBU_24]|uniref:beta-propeller fold lactonase family protein n=1 Tax=Flavobacterium sp. RHBU_24 TaxID=3391185 RepID=UPI0039852E67
MPSGRLLFLANENSNNIVPYNRHIKKGALAKTDTSIQSAHLYTPSLSIISR